MITNNIIENAKDPRFSGKIQGIVMSENGYVMYLKRSGNTSQRISGYDTSSPEVISVLNELCIPYVDVSLKTALAIHLLPIIDDVDMGVGPIHSSSRVPFQVFASMAKALESTVGNIDTINMIEEMFYTRDAFYKMLEIQNMAISNGIGAIISMLKGGISYESFEVPEGVEYDLYRKLTDQLDLWSSKFNESLTNLDEARKQACATHGFSSTEYKDACKGVRLKNENLNMTKRLENIVGWNALMVKAGNQSHTQAFSKISEFIGNITQEINHERETLKDVDYLKKILKKDEFGGVVTFSEKYLNSVLKAIGRESKPSADSMAASM